MSALITQTNDSSMNGVTEHYGIAHSQIVTQTSEFDEKNLSNRREQVLHDANGNFAVGNPGGPGRPRTRRISEAYKAILDTEGADKFAAQVAKDSLEATRAADRLAAISEMTAYTEGKPMQNVRMAGVFMVAAPDSEVLASVFGAEMDE